MYFTISGDRLDNKRKQAKHVTVYTENEYRFSRDALLGVHIQYLS